MEYLVGTNEEFFEFVSNINDDDRVAILTHTDLDGLASGIFLEEILEKKEKSVDLVSFVDYSKDFFEKARVLLEKNNITKVFILDVSAESMNMDEFEEFRRDYPVFLIDHHPMAPEFANKIGMIKGDSKDCTAFMIYNLGEGLIDPGEWRWLVSAAIFSDYSYKGEENLKFLQEIYPGLTYENISSTTPGINGRKISLAIIYYQNDLGKVYDLLKEKNMEEISEVSGIVEEEIEKNVDGFLKNSEYLEDKKAYFYEINSKFNITSYVLTLLSKMKLDHSFFGYSFKGPYIKISARHQDGKRDMGKLMRDGTRYLEGAVGGGHAPAAAAKIKRDDFSRFKNNLIKNL
jgi:nanoRNase/pAp phosphatase (c-di-AMP/oligoRNAs hydrolase)